MAKKKLTGKVVSDKMQKTVVVAVEIPTKHFIYRKSIKNTNRIKARNDINVVMGDKVIIEECAPFSKQVAWQVLEKLED